MLQPERICPLNAVARLSSPKSEPARGRYVLYWMQAAQRAEFNHALEYAIRQANALRLPLLVGFGLTGDYPQANLRHYTFMLQGLAETQQALARRGIRLVARRGSPGKVALALAREAALLVTDRGYTRHQLAWRRRVAKAARCPVVQVETDVVVPVAVAADRSLPSAAALRTRLAKHLPRYLTRLQATPLARDSLGMKLPGLDLRDVAAVLRPMRLDRSVKAVAAFVGGTSQANRRLRTFLEHKLATYAQRQSDPGADNQSRLSPYLHFGQISPVAVALAVRRARTAGAAKDAFLEQLIVRRELSFNLLHYNASYDAYRAVPAWARATLKAHAANRRPARYTLAQLRSAETHDDYWNAAMREMLLTGTMHGYMRMYWGKKILEWTASPRTAFRWATALNNAYFLDGRDPNSWSNVAWCFGLHDQPFPQRAVFGTVRSMTAGGLERKFNMDAYLARVARLG